MISSASPVPLDGSISSIPPATKEDGWDRVAYYALLISIFLSGWNVLRVGSINLTLSDVALLVCFFITAGRGGLSFTPFGSLTLFWLLGLILMLGGLFIGSVVNGDPMRWVIIALQYIVSFLLIPMILMQQDSRTRQLAPLLFALGTALSEAIGIVVSMLMNSSDAQQWLGSGFLTGNLRLGAMAGEPNRNGAVVAFAMPMLLYSLRRGQIAPIPALACFMVLAWGLVLTASFTGFSTTVLTLFICMLLMGGIGYIFRFGAIAAVCGGIFFAAGGQLPAIFQQRVGNALSSGDMAHAGTFLDRAQLMEEAWGFAEKYSIIGMGVDRYRELSAHDNPVHNLYLLIWNEGSIIAITGLIIMLTLLGIMAASKIRMREQVAPYIAVLLVFLIYTTSYPHMYMRMWVMPLMVMLAILYIPPGRSGVSGERRSDVYDQPPVHSLHDLPPKS